MCVNEIQFQSVDLQNFVKSIDFAVMVESLCMEV